MKEDVIANLYIYYIQKRDCYYIITITINGDYYIKNWFEYIYLKRSLYYNNYLEEMLRYKLEEKKSLSCK